MTSKTPDDAHAPTVADTVAAPRAPDSGSPPPTPDARYVLRGLLGRGGMGEVWLAHDIRIDRDIAIKMLRTGRDDPDSVARFLREARVQGRLEHPAIVPVHDVGDTDTPYFAMKRLAGTTLADVLVARGRGDPKAIERWTRRILLARLVDVCHAIELAHDRGVIHRDLKPANIMLGDFGETYVLDWGLARLVDSTDAEQLRITSGDGSGSGETVAGVTLGTPGYMSPEQMRGETIDVRTDVFSLGCVLYEILTDGDPAIPRSRVFEVTLDATSHRPRERRPDTDIPPELDELCARATAATPAERPTAGELANAIQRFLDGDRDVARRRELAAEHLAAGSKLLANDDQASRGEAMRAGARALALDPESKEAQEFVGRLLLQPPKQTPPEALEEIERDRVRAGQSIFRVATFAYAVFFAGVVFTIFASARHPIPLFVMAGLCVGLAVLSHIAATSQRKVSPWMFAAMFLMHIAALVAVGLTFGVLLVLPVILVGTMSTTLTNPLITYQRLIIVALLLIVPICVALELAGVVPSTFRVEDSRIIIELWAIEISPTLTVFGTILIIVLQLAASAALGLSHRRSQQHAEERVHIHLWHLRQLIPRG